MIEQYVKNLTKHLNGHAPDTLLILGSGLGVLAETLQQRAVVAYEDIGFPVTKVSGHKGALSVGKLGKHEVACMQGRFHLYEGHNPQLIKDIMCAFFEIGVKNLIVTNAAGSLRSEMSAGSLMLITDHINLSGRNPLVGANDEKYGPRFPDMGNAYDEKKRALFKSIAAQCHIKLYEGVYLMVLGPNFETPAEIKAFQVLGADAVGMSTVPEVLAAIYAGMKILGVSVITNLGAGMQANAQSHVETLRQAASASENLKKLIELYLEEE